MDSLTHTVLGACMGEAIAGKKLGKKAMLFGALANNLPDIDVVAGFWNSPATQLLAHRGLTHSILAAFGFTFLLAWFFKRRSKTPDMSLQRWQLLFGANILTHLFIDAFTTYGTGWFEPFSHARVSFNTMFILDPFFMLPVLVAAIILLVLRKSSPRRYVVASAAIVLSCLYAGYTWVNKLVVKSAVEQNLKTKNIPHTDYMYTPTALQNFLWYIVAKNDSINYIGYYSVFDKDEDIIFYPVAKDEQLLADYNGVEDVDKLRRFSKGYYCVTRNADTTVFSDMRFGQLGGWDNRSAFVFRFDLNGGKGNITKLQQGRFKGFKGDEVSKLIERVKGNK